MPRHVTSQTIVHPATKPGYSIAGELTERSSLGGFRVTLVHDELVTCPIKDRHFWARGVSS